MATLQCILLQYDLQDQLEEDLERMESTTYNEHVSQCMLEELESEMTCALRQRTS